MIGRILNWLFYALIVAIAAFFLIGPSIAERSVNQVDGEPLAEVTDEARALHASLTIVDLHSDSLLWSRNLLRRNSYGHMDLPRLIDGNVTVQVFSSVTQSPWGQNYDSNASDSWDKITPLAVAQLQPLRTWNSLSERSLYHAQRFDRTIDSSEGVLRAIDSPAAIDALMRTRASAERQQMLRPLGALLSAEGLQSLEGDPANLRRMYEAGYRMASLTHFIDTEWAGSMHGEGKGGLTDEGRKLVLRMEQLGMIVDVAHCSHACVADIVAVARRPVISSHGGVQAICDINRNLTDDEIRGIASTGGVIGVGYWDGAVCSTDPAATAKAMKHVRDLVGIRHVALGSDFDGAVTTRFDTAGLVHVTQALIDEGFSESEIRAAMGGNALRVLREGLRPL